MESTIIRRYAVPFPGIALQYRPKSYFWPLGLRRHLLAQVKGAERKAALRELFDAGLRAPIPSILTTSSLTAPERQVLGRIHPAFLGGEFLPDLKQDEIEIARITIASVTQDVTSVYARRGRYRIYYRVVDDYEGETLSGRSRRTSNRPLTLAELEQFLNEAWPLFQVLNMNFGADGYDVAAMLRFVTAESQFYPQFGELYEGRIRAWAAGQHARMGSLDDGDESSPLDDSPS
jgi:hypothetical protein